jgi:geranylgeranyl pyrophosphate synthase
MGGKGFRPVKYLAAAVHMLQASTFIVDDVLDESSVRYRRRTLSSLIGPGAATCLGAILEHASLAETSRYLRESSLPNASAALHHFLSIPLEVYSGQYLDLANSSRLNLPISSYFLLIDLTTSRFLARIAMAGALLADLSPNQVRRAGSYARHYGISLQICDDILDLTDAPSNTGKPFAVDLREKRLRLPLMLALREASSSDRCLLASYLHPAKTNGRTTAAAALRAINRTSAIPHSRELAAVFAAKAVRDAHLLPDHPSSAKLALLAQSLLNDLEVPNARSRS